MKACPLGHTILDPHYSTNRYWCFECRKFYPFPLRDGKKSILIEGLVGGQANDTSAKNGTDTTNK